MSAQEIDGRSDDQGVRRHDLLDKEGNVVLDPARAVVETSVASAARADIERGQAHEKEVVLERNVFRYGFHEKLAISQFPHGADDGEDLQASLDAFSARQHALLPPWSNAGSLLKPYGFYVKPLIMKNKSLNPFNKGVFIWLFIILLILFLFNMYHKPRKQYENVTFSDFMESVNTDQVASVTIQGKNISGTYKDGREFKTYAPDDPDLVKLMQQHRVKIQAKPDDESGIWQSIFVSWFPMLLLIGVWIFFMRQMQAGGGKALAFGKSRARMATARKTGSPSRTWRALKRRRESWRR